METKMNKLFNGEKVIGEWLNSSLTLTNIRIFYEEQAFGTLNYYSIMLDQISFCGIKFKSKILHLMLAIVFGISSLYFIPRGESYNKEGSQPLMIFMIVIAVIFLVLYFLSRKSYFIIASSGGSIEIALVGIEPSKIKDISNTIESTRYGNFSKETVLEKDVISKKVKPIVESNSDKIEYV
jgi:hypothetical protein